MKNANKQPKLAENLSILYVESNQLLQQELTNHFKKIFSFVYQAFDGIEGLETFKNNSIDVVITDLSLINKNSFEMIIEMQEINPDLSIIVLSNQNSDFHLLQTLDIGLIALLEKPLNITSLNKALEKVISINKPKIKAIPPVQKQEPIKPKPKPIIPPVQKQEPIKPKPKPVIPPVQKQEPIKPKIVSCFDILNLAQTNKSNVQCINSYKGLSITSATELQEVKENSLILQVNKSQLTAIAYEKGMILKIKPYSIYAKLIHIDKQNSTITLANPQLIHYVQRDSSSKRITVDKSFKASLGIENIQKELTPIDISFNYIYLETNEPLDLKIDSSIELTIGFEINGPSSLVSEKKFTKTFATGVIQRIQIKDEKQFIVVRYHVQKSGENVYKKYLQERELAIISEFKMKMKM